MPSYELIALKSFFKGVKKMKKRKILIFILSIISIVSIFFVSLKANAASFGDNGIVIRPDNDTCLVFFNIPYGTDNIELIKNSNYDNILVASYSGYTFNYNGSLYTEYYANNDNSRPLYSNRLYCFSFENTINRYTFYEIEIELTEPNSQGVFTISSSDITVVELFTISQPTGYQSSFQMIGQSFIARQDVVFNSNGYSTEIANYISYYCNTISFYEYAKNEYRYGYSSGYNVGYNDGQTGENAISPFFNVLSGIFTSIGAIFSIELVPHVPIGLFFLVPLFFAIVGLILFIWRKNF